MRRYLSLFAAMGLVVGLCALIVVSRPDGRMARLALSNIALPTSGEAEVPDGLQTDLRDALVRNPIDQDLVTLYYGVRSRSGADETELAAIRKPMGELGWRSTIAQQNIIVSDLNSRNFEGVIKRADALLRREKLQDEIVQLLYAVEVEPSTQSFLVNRLILDPPWRGRLLERLGPLKSQQQLEARARTIAEMHRRREPISRNERATALQAMVNNGMYEQAWELAVATEQDGRTDQIIQDPDFDDLVMLRRDPDALPSPFAWQLTTRPGAFRQAHYPVAV